MNSIRSGDRPQNKRQYIRLNSVFPVEFTIVRLQGDLPGVDWQQGHTSNVSGGGLCLETVGLSDTVIQYIHQQNIFIELRIHVPLGQPAVKAVAEIAWFEKSSDEIPHSYILGLKFRSIADKDLSRVLSQARWLKFTTQSAVIASIFLTILTIITSVYAYKLNLANEETINKLFKAQQEEIEANGLFQKFNEEKQTIADALNQLTQFMQSQPQPADMDPQFKEDLLRWKERLSPLKYKYQQVLERQNKTTDLIAMIERKKEDLQKDVLGSMHDWLKNHQHPSTGLILSFEGDVGVIKNWAFLYDQALAVNVLLLFDDDLSARRILDFFYRHLKGELTGFNNGYYYDSGKISEYTVHTGPNTWLGIAALQYVQKTGDREYLALAQTIGDWLISLQERDPEKGIKGGPGVFWFSTEHNLDAYAFFGMLFEVTQEEKYKLAQQKTLSWLKSYAMIPHSDNHKAPPVNRGKGDATIATDTFAWALAAIGPKQLQNIGMDPEYIMTFAEENCAVEAVFRRPSGINISIKGFDFAKSTHIPRGAIVSPEWTSQMIVSYQMLSAFFAEENNPPKAQFYQEKAKLYLSELNKLIIASPSARGQGKGCLPYATMEQADTGHGWSTPKGLNTCSVAGTAYMIMAVKKFNPLMLKN